MPKIGRELQGIGKYVPNGLLLILFLRGHNGLQIVSDNI